MKSKSEEALGIQYIYLFFAVYVLVFLSFEQKSTPTQIFSHPQFPPSKLPAHPPVVFWYLLHSARIPLSRHFQTCYSLVVQHITWRSNMEISTVSAGLTRQWIIRFTNDDPIQKGDVALPS